MPKVYIADNAERNLTALLDEADKETSLSLYRQDTDDDGDPVDEGAFLALVDGLGEAIEYLHTLPEDEAGDHIRTLKMLAGILYCIRVEA